MPALNGLPSGDFDYNIEANTGDEVQELAHQFNIMAQALKAYYAELEDRVKRRTSELAESEERFRAAADENAAMAEIGRIVGSSLDISLVYDRFSEQTKRLIHADIVAVMNVHPEEQRFSVAFTAGMPLTERQRGEKYPLEGTTIAETLLHWETCAVST